MTSTTEAQLLRLAAGAGWPMEGAERLTSGGNSRTYLLSRRGGPRIAAKLYHQARAGGRDRVRTEFRGLSFLWNNGVRDIPQPLACFPERRVALYQWIEGSHPAPESVGPGEIEQAVGFLQSLLSLRGLAGAEGLGKASEACFSLDEVVQNLRQRYERLANMPPDQPLGGELGRFLRKGLVPVWEAAERQARALLAVGGLSPDACLGPVDLVLSPSDFGFHNALRRADGRLAFIDFEYFGWDDPAKTIADFLLHPHPVMQISPDMRAMFRREALRRLGTDRQALEARLIALMPLYGIKWCLILLNEFVPADLARRRFAAGGLEDAAASRRRQLDKARDMLTRVRKSLDDQSLLP